MRIEAHCFADNVKIDKLPITFKSGDYKVSIQYHSRKEEEKLIEGLILQIEKEIDPSELSTIGETKDNRGEFIAKRMRPYQEALFEASQALEGMLAIMYNAEPPKFAWGRAIINVIAENPSEEQLLRDDKVASGFGTIEHPPRYPVYQWDDKFNKNLEEATKHIPGLSFVSQAFRSEVRNDHEVAFFLYFRVIDGYFSDGDKDVEKALLNKSKDLAKYLIYNDQIKDATKAVLTELKLNSKSHIDFNGLISDLVLIRHKLTHFSTTNQDRHHRATILFDLSVINLYLRRACAFVLREKLSLP